MVKHAPRQHPRPFAAWCGIALVAGLLLGELAVAQTNPPVSDIRATRHNFSTRLSADNYASLNPARRTQLQDGLTSGTGAGGRTIYSSVETEICVFCHTPHAASMVDQGGNRLSAPLWNRTVRAPTNYRGYRSTSMDATGFTDMAEGSTAGRPEGSSKLCLSCHDGAIAIGQVNVRAGRADGPTTLMAGTGNLGTMPDGAGTYLNKLSGNTRNLGTDLTNDHPISVTFDSTLATADGELRPVDTNQKWSSGATLVVGKRTTTDKPRVPLEATGSGGEGQVQCASCHDPHVAPSTTNPENNQKFLRLNRFQTTAAPVPDSMASSFNPANDIICLSCHNKEGWAYSAHAHTTTTATYTAQGATDRGFPSGIPVWRVACLNCHDTHAVSGTRRLLREGVTGPLISGTTIRQGTAATNYTFGTAALENACYQCHSQAATASVRVVDQQATSSTSNTVVPDIMTDFVNGTYKMPIAKNPELHSIESFTSGATSYKAKDLSEPRARLGLNDNYSSTLTEADNRHAECSDCHNPHRLRKTKLFSDTPTTTVTGYGQATHHHDTAGTHSNIISGALRGAWGVEPIYSGTNGRLSQYVPSQLSTLTGTEFNTPPTDFTVKVGDPGTAAPSNPAVTANYVTREYQICLKCHSNFAYPDNQGWPDGHVSATRPNLGCVGCSPKGSVGTDTRAPNLTNGLKRYTNQAMEFYAPNSHVGETNAMKNSGAHVRYETTSNYNHRSWHPVMKPTGRHSGQTGSFRSPWNQAASMGTQTMYCSDCHGNDVGAANSVNPTTGRPWGPHGSINKFILKSTWFFNNVTGAVNSNGDHDLCFKCHIQPNTTSGFDHATHADKVENLRCSACHIAVPHGWKNKSLLVNLNDVGPEVMCRSGVDPAITEPACTAGQPIPPGTIIKQAGLPYTNPPYYMGSYLKILTFRQSVASGQATYWTENGSCGDLAAGGRTGQDWMRNTCEGVP